MLFLTIFEAVQNDKLCRKTTFWSIKKKKKRKKENGIGIKKKKKKMELESKQADFERKKIGNWFTILA